MKAYNVAAVVHNKFCALAVGDVRECQRSKLLLPIGNEEWKTFQTALMGIFMATAQG